MPTLLTSFPSGNLSRYISLGYFDFPSLDIFFENFQKVMEKVSKHNALPDWIIKLYDNVPFQTYLMWVQDFYDAYVKVANSDWIKQKELSNFYSWLEYFNNLMLIPITNEVLFQLDDEWRVIAFAVFGRRWKHEDFIRWFVVSVHPNYWRQKRSKELIKLVTVRAKELGYTKVYRSSGNVQNWDTDTKNWRGIILSCLQSSWLDIIDGSK